MATITMAVEREEDAVGRRSLSLGNSGGEEEEEEEGLSVSAPCSSSSSSSASSSRKETFSTLCAMNGGGKVVRKRDEDGHEEQQQQQEEKQTRGVLARGVVVDRPTMSHPRSSKSWIRRVKDRSEELKEMFELDSGEQLIDTFMCALKKRILLQGRMYVFDHHVCFSCSLFGYHKIKVIPLDRIIEVKKKKNVGFPNSILIVWKNSEGERKNEFFTSFLSREEAYKLIDMLWDQVVEESNSPASTGSKDVVQYNEHDVNGNRGSSLLPDTYHPFGYLNEPEEAQKQHYDDDDALKNKARHVSFFHESLEDIEDVDSVLEKQFENSQEAPEVASNMQKLSEYTLPVDPKGFYSAFLSAKSEFFEAFHAAQGHKDIKLSPWECHGLVGPVRDLAFKTSLKGFKIGPPEALCHQTHRFNVYKGNHVVFETSQVMMDIPYGDHFKVETRWDIQPHASQPGTSSLTIHVAVPFTKNTLWKKFIERGVTGSLLEAYQMFRKLADEKIACMEPDASLYPKNEAGLQTPDAGKLISRKPTTPADLLPNSKEDWEMMLAQIEPKFRGGLCSLRRMQENIAKENQIKLTTPHHRRRTSIIEADIFEDFDADNAVESGSECSGEAHVIRPTVNARMEKMVSPITKGNTAMSMFRLFAVFALIFSQAFLIRRAFFSTTSATAPSMIKEMHTAWIKQMEPKQLQAHLESFNNALAEFRELQSHTRLMSQKLKDFEDAHDTLNRKFEEIVHVFDGHRFD
jgi:hypothetical protein